MILDRIQLGQPAYDIQKFLERWGWLKPRQPIPIGEKAYYDLSLNHYGRAKKQHEISYTLGKPTTVSEKITYLFKGGSTHYLYHKISAPVQGGITKLRVEAPKDIHCQVDGLYSNLIKITLNKPLPREGVKIDKVVLEIEYKTDAYTDDVGVLQSIEFSSPLPTVAAKFSIQSLGANQALKEPTVRIVEGVDGRYFTLREDGRAKNWKIVTNTNKADIRLSYPTVATIYQIQFKIIECLREPQENKLEPASLRKI